MHDVEKIRFELKRPLLILKARNGFLACGYINIDTCNKTDEACAIVTGVGGFQEMAQAAVVAVSHKARELGVTVGESGEAALAKMR